MTSILEPFASKKRPNETGTCSVYASVNVIKNIENNENKVFTIEGDAATTTFPLAAPSISIENPVDNKNAVNKEYCDENYIRNGVSKLTVDNLIVKESLSFQPTDNTFPQGTLYNLIPSDITSNQLEALTAANRLDNVCPTYQYCQNTYAKIGSVPSMTGFQRIVKRKRLWYYADKQIDLTLAKEEVTNIIKDTIDFSDFPIVSSDDELEFWITGDLVIDTIPGTSGDTSVLTVLGKGNGIAGLLSLDFNLWDTNNSIPLNWSVKYASSSRAIIKINTVARLFATDVINRILPKEAAITYYSANYTKNPLRYRLEKFKVYATLIRTV